MSPDPMGPACSVETVLGPCILYVATDYRMRACTADVSPTTAAESISTFTEAELEAMKAEAHRLGVKIAAHAQEPSTLASLARVRYDSIEHGSGMGSLCSDEITGGTWYGWSWKCPVCSRKVLESRYVAAEGGSAGLFYGAV